MATIEIRADIGNITQIAKDGAGVFIPHTFMQITGSDGTVTTVGLNSNPTGIFGPGEVSDNTKHDFDASSGKIQITDAQYQKLKNYVDRTTINPPVYDIIGGKQCATWVRDGLYEAGIVNVLDVPIGMAFLDTLAFNPYVDALLLTISSFVNDTFTTAQNWVAPRSDPLILDLNGNGIETIAANRASPILFDHDGDRIKSGTGWIAPSDGFLALDRNGNGAIDNGSELFGNSTLVAGGVAADGFAALAQQDTNADGVVNAQDANFANLRVWQDLNQDGVSQQGELKTLADLDIASINVANTEHSSMLPGGNEIADLGSFTRTDGTTSIMADVNLAADTFHRSFSDVIPATPQTVALPDMQGSGVINDVNIFKYAANDAVFEVRRLG